MAQHAANRHTRTRDQREGTDAAQLRARLAEIDRERATITRQLAELERAPEMSPDSRQTESMDAAPISNCASSEAKIALFRRLFRGRADVFPRRWENAKTGKVGYAPACANEWIPGVCGKPRVKCGACPNQAFIPVSDRVIRAHLEGRWPDNYSAFVAGVYPLLADETCWFVAIDFDKGPWMHDIAALRKTARDHAIPLAVERSRSGTGGHAWIFFSEPVPAADARRLASLLISATMDRRPDIGFDSYDRIFPSQDTLPASGFGNLIALPLQRGPRSDGNSVFVDASFRPYDDQWAFLAGLDRLSRIQLAQRLQAFPHGSAGGVPLPTTTEADDPEPWTAPPSGRDPDPPIAGPLPASAELVLGDRIYIPRAGLPSPLINRLGRLAAFQNPAFYAAQRMRLSTHATPRVINCGELFAEHIALPRGCLEAARGLLERHGVNCDVRDVRYPGAPLGVAFRGTLTPEQDAARNALLAHETGVLAATTAFGKTVVAASLIAERGVNTLVLVHRRHLLEQWVERLQSFLDLDAGDVGVVHGGRRRPTGRVDVALIQSLYRRGTVADRVADYGHVVIDECHHVSAVSFEAVARAAKARYVLGLSATVTRKDGHHPIVFMQCGPVRHRVDARQQAAARPFDHRVVFRSTGFRHRRTAGEAEPALQTLYTSLTKDPDRNALILADVRHALEAGRCPVVITERRDHAEVLAGALDAVAGLVVTLRGGLGARERRAAQAALAAAPPSGGRVIVATGRYLGEGFDDARLDTLFLTMPVAWRGTIAQYAGRLHRLHANKRDVVIYDYIDEREPVLARMADKRAAGYRRLGYRTDEPTPLGV